MEILQFISSFSGSTANGCYLWFWSLLDLRLRLLGSGVLWQLLGEREKLRGSWKILSERFRYIKPL